MNLVVGGWNVSKDITSDQMKIFHEAVEGMIGVEYEPVMIATQVVGGFNYYFLCISTMVRPDSPKGIAKILVYRGIDAKPVAVSIETVL